MTESPLHDQVELARRSRTRRLTLLLALAATGVYAAFIVLHVLRAPG